jgi:hypothetical protein
VLCLFRQNVRHFFGRHFDRLVVGEELDLGVRRLHRRLVQLHDERDSRREVQLVDVGVALEAEK